MGHRGRLTIGVLCAMAAGCETDGTYEASVIALERDVLASLTVAADGDIELRLERWYGSEAFGWERCPVLHAEATVNGAPMAVVNAGGWVPVQPGDTIFDGGGGHCEPMIYRLLDPPAAILQSEDIQIELRDEGGAIAIEVPFIGTPELALAEPRVLVPGARAVLEVLPSVQAIDFAAITAHYEGELAQKTPGNARTGFEAGEIEATETGMAFIVPAMQPDSHGVLRLLHETPGSWPLRVTRCKGVGGCQASKVLSGAIGLELSVSTTGDAVEPDSREDHAQWHYCWLSGEVTGNLELAWTDALGCQWNLTEQRVLQVRYSEGPYDSFTLRIEDFAPEQGARQSAQVDVKLEGVASMRAECSVVIDRVWTEIRSSFPTVVEGTGECSPGASAVQPFAFRAPGERR